jgi:membrane glycosyltransferase
MMFHTQFIVLTLCRQNVSWGVQRRGRAGASVWGETVAAHWGQTLLGLAGGVLVYRIDPALAAWMSPILAGLVLSIPLSYFTGSLPIGVTLRQHGIFQTPEESRPPIELAELTGALGGAPKSAPLLPELMADYGLLQAVLDPYVNAVHVSLLRVKDDPPPASEERFALLCDLLLREGPGALAPHDRLAVLMDVESMNALHKELWATPASQLALWWRLALRHYTSTDREPRAAIPAEAH